MPFIPDNVGFTLPVKTGFVPDSPEASRADKIAQLRLAQTKAERESKQANSFAGQAGTFGKELVGGLANAFLKQPARFAVSAATAPIDIPRQVFGQKPLNVDIPLLGKTFQREASDEQEKLYDKAYAGEGLTLGDYGTALKPFAEVPLAATEAVGTGSLLKAGTKQVTSMAAREAEKKAARATQDLIEIVSPKITPVKGAKDIASGKGVAPSLFKTGRIDQSEVPFVQKAAEAVRGVVKKGKSFIDNVNSVLGKIEDVSENAVRPFLSQNKVPFHFENLRNKLQLVQPDDVLKADPGAFKTYGEVRERLLQSFYNQLNKSGNKLASTDYNELWDARKALDSQIQRELGDKIFGTPQFTGVKAAARDMRRAFSEFIVDGLQYPGQMERVNQLQDFIQVARGKGIDIPNEGEAVKLLQRQFGLTAGEADVARAAFFRDSMERMNAMYDAVTNMSPKAVQEIGKTGYQLWMKNHPLLKEVLKGGAFATGAGGLFTGASLFKGE